ncbi:hypothetical protein SLEP1_g1890 [Rubroshorea leprosula]|uniref:Protein kinase domain-containing protein n=2 Tax=Rubroshorea leprosula TaxID=152421 RepID=A0AAV5HMF7_9ROSI|nr:hypothetical protein SLEP1_g1890 [Rubroshorea leprosula]
MADDRAISLEEIKTQSVDLERIPVEEVLEQLKCTRAGLTSEEGARRLQVFGLNKLEEKKESKILKFLGFMWNPLSWVMEAAAIMAIVMANGGGRPPNWQEFVGIVVLLLINSTISFIEENKAGNAAAALMADLAPKTKVLRDGQWNEQDAAILVPGDIITIKLGDIIPADARLLEGDPLKIDQSALTGESLPVTKSPSDEVFSGSICKQGEIEAVVIATGVHSFLGKAEHLVDGTNQVGHFQKVLTAIGNFCICSIFIGLFIEAVVMYGIQHRNYRDGIDNLLVLLIGGTPIAMPTVLSAPMAIGSQRLSQQGAITKRRTAIEEMARMDVLCSDKTGTLTLNKLTVERNLIEVFVEGIEMDRVILQAARASRTENQDAIDAAIVGMLADPKEARAGIKEVHFLPFNPVDKRTALTYIDSNGNWHRASKGAPEQILDLCNSKGDVRKKDMFSVILPKPWHGPYGTDQEIMAALYLQVATLIAVYANWDFAKIKGIGWRQAGVIWLYSVVTYFPLFLLKFTIQYLHGRKTAFTTKNLFSDKNSYRELSEIAEETKHRAEGHVESDVKLKGLDIGTVAFDASTMEKFLQEWDKEKPVRYTAQQLDDFTRNYSKRLGSGAYGDVYDGQFPNGVKIAVKLLKEKYEVADFGLAKLCNRDNTHDSVTGFKGTLGYSAPELFLRNHPITYKCDVYSFGMLLFEIVGRRKNTVSSSSEIVDWFPKVVLDKYQKCELAELIKSYGIKKEDMEKAERMSLVALWCVQDSPGARPPMSAVVKMLEGGVEIMPPPKPTHLLFSSLGTNAVKPPNAATGSSSSSSEESASYWYKETTSIMAKYEIQVASS